MLNPKWHLWESGSNRLFFLYIKHNNIDIDNIQDPTKKKLYYINKISLQNPKSKSLDEGTDKESDVSEKSSKETPKRSQSVTESLLKGLDSSSESSPNKKKVNIYHDIIRSAFKKYNIIHLILKAILK